VTRRFIVEADGGSRGNPGPAGYGAVVRDARTGEVLAELSGALGTTTNNVAEYSGLIAGLREAARLEPGADTEVRLDSKLLVEQMSGRWQIKHPGLRPLAADAKRAASGLGRVTYRWVPRAKNTHADQLANQAMDAAAEGKSASAGGKSSAAPADGTVRQADLGESDRGAGAWRGNGTPVTTVLLRHGQTSLSPQRRFAGRGDVPLTQTGLRQARAAAVSLAGRDLTAVISSPLQRARVTAETVAAAAGLPVTVEDAWAETDFGEWEGLTFEEAASRWPDDLAAWRAGRGTAPPGGESMAAVTRRVLPALDALLAAHPGGRVLVASHVTPIKVVLRHALLAPPAALWRMFLDVASVCEIDWYPDGTALVRSMNDTAHLAVVDEPVSTGTAHQPALPGT
jgi:ribonuclease H / adenosylcobalamin/alpha-ribazole phosphatase